MLHWTIFRANCIATKVCNSAFMHAVCYAAQVLRSKSDKINVENPELLIQNIDLHIQVTIHTHYDKFSSSSRSDSPVQVQDQIIQVF